MKIEELHKLFLQHPQICTDTRAIIPNSIFFALRGENFNGNKYAANALNQGCSYAVVDDAKYATDSRCILVEDVLACMQKLASHHRKQFKIPVIGITGTNGKTTTKELIQAVLQKKYQVNATKGNLNNHIGVPLTLLEVNDQCEILIVEMGANHEGEIGFLSEIAQPNYGLITNIGKAHLEGFGSVETIARTKRELFNYIKNNDGQLFLNADDPRLEGGADGASHLTFGTVDGATVRAELTGPGPTLQFCWASEDYKSPNLSTNLIGGYNLLNALAAIAIGVHFDVGIDDINEAIVTYQPENNRSQFKQTDRNQVILDAYNANPDSMKAAIQNFNQTDGEKFFVLGDMQELGANSTLEHKSIVVMLQKLRLTNGILVGPEFAKVSTPDLKSVRSTADAQKLLEDESISNKLILLKGSRGMALEKLVKLL